MTFHRKLVCLWVLLALSACQSLPNLPSIPTALPTVTATITPGGPTLTPSPTITPTPLPTLPPVVRIDSGDEAPFYGDYDAARAQYQTAYNDSTDPALKAAALWGLGRTELADGNFQAALDHLNTLVSDYPDSTYSARAPFLMGQAYAGLEQHTQAAESYNTYMQRIPGVLDAYVQDYRGDELAAAKDYPGALAAYQARRSALISLSNLTDERMRPAKSGEWWLSNPQRALANNSVAYTEKPDIGIFMREWESLYESKSGRAWRI